VQFPQREASERTARPPTQSASAAAAKPTTQTRAPIAATAITAKRAVRTTKSAPSARRCEGALTAPKAIPRAAPWRAEGQEVLTTSRRGPPPARRQYNPLLEPAEGRSSTGRAPVSKTGGWRFESSRPCWLDHAESAPLSGRFPFSGRFALDRLKPLESARAGRRLSRNCRMRSTSAALATLSPPWPRRGKSQLRRSRSPTPRPAESLQRPLLNRPGPASLRESSTKHPRCTADSNGGSVGATASGGRG
jgi:hypothetical protein